MENIRENSDPKMEIMKAEEEAEKNKKYKIDHCQNHRQTKLPSFLSCPILLTVCVFKLSWNYSQPISFFRIDRSRLHTITFVYLHPTYNNLKFHNRPAQVIFQPLIAPGHPMVIRRQKKKETGSTCRQVRVHYGATETDDPRGADKQEQKCQTINKQVLHFRPARKVLLVCFTCPLEISA